MSVYSQKIPQKSSFWCYLKGIREFLDSGRKSWTLDSGHWTLEVGL